MVMQSHNVDVLSIKNKPLYTITEAARLLGSSTQTLRSYGKHGFVLPVRNGKRWLFAAADVTWLRCIQELIHVNKYSIEALKKLLSYAPCWEIKNCPMDRRASCSRVRNSGLTSLLRDARGLPQELSTAG